MRDHYKLDWWHSSIRNVKRTNQAIDGRFGLMLYNTVDTTPQGWSGWAQSIDHKNLDQFNGFPYTDGPLSLVFWNKHNLSEGDTAEISAVFKENGKLIGQVKFRFFGDSKMEYVKYSVPITWYYNTRTPDSVWLYMRSCTDDTVDGDGYVIFDDLHFEFAGNRTTEIPNASFETWSNIGIQFPTTWRSVDLYLFDTHSVFFKGQSIFRVNGPHAFNGENSLMIKNYDHFGELRAGFAYVGTSDEHLSNGAFSVDDNYQFIEGFYKYLSQEPDSGRLLYQTWDDGYHSSYDNFYFTPTNEWTYFIKAIRYADESGIPNQASLSLWSSNQYPAKNLDSELYIDNLQLVHTPTAKASQLKASPELVVFPNPSRDRVYIRSSEKIEKVIISNMLGESQEISVNGNALDVSHLSNGVYVLYLYKGHSLYTTTKLIKQ